VRASWIRSFWRNSFLAPFCCLLGSDHLDPLLVLAQLASGSSYFWRQFPFAWFKPLGSACSLATITFCILLFLAALSLVLDPLCRYKYCIVWHLSPQIDQLSLKQPKLTQDV
jgi:hypothetical protein